MQNNFAVVSEIVYWIMCLTVENLPNPCGLVGSAHYSSLVYQNCLRWSNNQLFLLEICRCNGKTPVSLSLMRKSRDMRGFFFVIL